MKQVITKLENDKYFFIASSGNVAYTLDLISEALRLFSINELKDAALGKELHGCNDFQVDYGDTDENFYIAFYDMLHSKKYEIELNGDKFIDDNQIPKLKFSHKNFKTILPIWINILKSKPLYILISQDESGWINLKGKEKLSAKEQKLVESFQQST